MDTVIAHEIVHAFQYTTMSSILGGGITNDEMWFVEGLATTIQGGNGFLSTMIQRSDATVSLSSWNGEYGSAFAAVRVLHEITNGGIQAFIDELESGGSLDDAFDNTIQADAGGLTGVANFATAANFINWFNTSGLVDAYMNDDAEFATGTGATRAGQGNIFTGDLDSTIANDGAIDNPGLYNLIFDTTSETEKFSIQIVANTGQSMDIESFDITSTGLGIGSVDLSLQSSAETAISTFDGAIQKASRRSYYGAVQNRMDQTITNLANAEENLVASESRILDLDMAKEMMNIQKYNILNQAAQAMLAQANQQTQGVLQLLR